jgi:predicted aspartyl protease
MEDPLKEAAMLLSHFSPSRVLLAHMTVAPIIFLLFLFLSTSCRGAPLEELLAGADSLFAQGEFEDAEVLYRSALEKDPANMHALTSRGRILLYAGRLEEAEIPLRKALHLDPANRRANLLLGEAYCRWNRFGDAAPLFRAAGEISRAEQLEHLDRKPPYDVDGGVDATTVDFIVTDPLPLVRIRINGVEVVVFIDTGAPGLGIDEELAEEVGAVRFGQQIATFAGGRKAPFEYGVIEEVRIGDFTVHNVPVHIRSGPKLLQTPDGEPTRGVLGTAFLYQFVSAFDYPRGQLILERRTDESLAGIQERAWSPGSVVVPFWMAGDHFMVAWGTANRSRPALFLIDTGLAGGGFMGGDDIVREARIPLPEESFEAMGGGGATRAKRAVVDRVTLGNVVQRGVVGFFGGTPPLSKMLGFRVAGIVSHGFFRSYRVIFDFQRMRLVLEPS